MATSKRLRYEILRRDNHTCRYCGRAAPDVPLTVDHVIPVALGGTDDPTNLVAACRDCNSGKTSTPADSPIVADVALDALRWARAMQWAADEQARETIAEQSYIDSVDEAWRGWSWTSQDDTKHVLERPVDWERSCRQWRNAGADIGLVLTAIDLAMKNTAVRTDGLWSYTAGIVWNRLRERQQMAREHLDSESQT